MSDKLKNKVVVITGASSGIGRAAAELFEERGATVVCLARRTVPDFYCISTDVADECAVFSAVKEIEERFGRIDILVNNAGMGISGAVEDTSAEDAHAIFEVNFFGAFNMIRAAVPLMRRGGGGTKINGSPAAPRQFPPLPFFHFATTGAPPAPRRGRRFQSSPGGSPGPPEGQ